MQRWRKINTHPLYVLNIQVVVVKNLVGIDTETIKQILWF